MHPTTTNLDHILLLCPVCTQIALKRETASPPGVIGRGAGDDSDSEDSNIPPENGAVELAGHPTSPAPAGSEVS